MTTIHEFNNPTSIAQMLAKLQPVQAMHGNPCIMWGRAVSNDGYPMLSGKTGTSIKAPRLMALIATPGGQRLLEDESLQVHHICHRRACMNPTHLEVLTPTEHYRRHHPFDLPEGAEIV